MICAELLPRYAMVVCPTMKIAAGSFLAIPNFGMKTEPRVRNTRKFSTKLRSGLRTIRGTALPIRRVGSMGNMIPCPDCDGEGRVEYDLPRPHGFGRDVGYIDTVMDDCETCSGHGEIEEDE